MYFLKSKVNPCLGAETMLKKKILLKKNPFIPQKIFIVFEYASWKIL